MTLVEFSVHVGAGSPADSPTQPSMNTCARCSAYAKASSGERKSRRSGRLAIGGESASDEWIDQDTEYRISLPLIDTTSWGMTWTSILNPRYGAQDRFRTSSIFMSVDVMRDASSEVHPVCPTSKQPYQGERVHDDSSDDV